MSTFADPSSWLSAAHAAARLGVSIDPSVARPRRPPSRGVVTMAGVVGSMCLYWKARNRALSQVVNHRTVRLSSLPGTPAVTGRAENVVVREPFPRRRRTRRGSSRAQPAPAAATRAVTPSSAGARGAAGATPAEGGGRR
jgi:hypothetical protein